MTDDDHDKRDQPPSDTRAPVATELEPTLGRRLEDRVREEQISQKLPTLVAGLARDGALVWWSSAGTTGAPEDKAPDADTQYRIGSISKTFVAVAVMRLRDEGALDLNDLIGAHVPELADLPMTIAHLLSHTSGLPAEPFGPWWERVPGEDFAELVVSTLQRQNLLWRPGRRFHYSNVGFAVLGELVGRLRSAPFGHVLRNELLEPLGMARTSERPVAPFVEGFAVHPHADLVQVEPEHHAGAMAPAGQLWSTLEDLARWSSVLGGKRSDILRQESAAEMAEPLALFDMPKQPWVGAYGLGLQIQNRAGRRRFGHAGAMPGHWATVAVDAQTKDVLLAAANSTYRGHRATFFDDLYKLLSDAPQRPQDTFVPRAPDGPHAVELLGTWYWGPVEVRIGFGGDGRLELRGIEPGRDCDFLPAGDGTYVGQFGYFDGERLRVHERSDGSVSHIDIATFVFTRTPYDPAVEGVPGGVDPRGWYVPPPPPPPPPVPPPAPPPLTLS